MRKLIKLSKALLILGVVSGCAAFSGRNPPKGVVCTNKKPGIFRCLDPQKGESFDLVDPEPSTLICRPLDFDKALSNYCSSLGRVPGAN